MATKEKKYLLKYANTKTESITAISLVDAQKIGHKKAKEKKTLLIHCTQIN